MCSIFTSLAISSFKNVHSFVYWYHLWILGALSMVAIDLAGHLHSMNDLGTGSHCMFTYTRANYDNTHSLRYPVLEMHWAVLIAPNILLGIGPPIVVATIFEFISAQSPSSMIGFLLESSLQLEVSFSYLAHWWTFHFLPIRFGVKIA